MNHRFIQNVLIDWDKIEAINDKETYENVFEL